MPSAVKPEGYEGHYSVADLAKYVGVTPRTIERWYVSQKIPAPAATTVPGGMKLWSPAQARKVLEDRMVRLPSARRAARRITK
jgi:hypothetical protein